MSETNANEGPDSPQPRQPVVGNLGSYSQQFSHSPVAARVPEHVRGVMSTGVLVLDSPTEFVLDFLQGISRPFQVAARVVIAPPMMGQLINAVTENLSKYTATYGAPPALPKPPAHRPTIQEIYENFKLPEELMSGAYSNSVMVGHSAAEFFFDFITGFYPKAALSARVFISAPHMPRVLETLTIAGQQYQKRYNAPKPPKEENSGER